MSAFDFNEPLTRDVTNWGTLLVNTLKESFTQISKQIADINVNKQIEQLADTLAVGTRGSTPSAIQRYCSDVTEGRITSRKGLKMLC